ncbi:MAG: hypothetical protein J5645_02550, partial [Lachnospiraceae bacterium]|nr:hypothetical protein [Lachnospiraceae bacterium]
TLAFKKPLYPEIYSLKFASVARNFTKNFKVVSLFGFQGSDPLQRLIFKGLRWGFASPLEVSAK